jgi:hypothetical protein
MTRLGGKLIRHLLPVVVHAVNVTVYLGLRSVARILVAIMVALFLMLFLIDSRQTGQAPSRFR